MIYTVTFNPAIDYVVYVSELKVGKTNRSQREDVFLGGKGINVSTVLTNLGVDNVALGFVAGATGELVERGLKDRGINTDFIHLPEGNTRINVKIRGEAETEVNGRGPHIPQEYIEQLMDKLSGITSSDVVVLSGSVPGTVSKHVYANIMERLAEKSVKVVVDAAGELMKNVLAYHPFLIKPNRAELEGLAGKVLDRTREIMRSARDLQEQGARNVLVSMAGDGDILVAEDGSIYEAEAPDGTVVNSVGAGDSMVAGFLAGYLQSGSYETAFQMGVCTGSASAFSEELATKEEVERLLKQYRKRF